MCRLMPWSPAVSSKPAFVPRDAVWVCFFVLFCFCWDLSLSCYRKRKLGIMLKKKEACSFIGLFNIFSDSDSEHAFLYHCNCLSALRTETKWRGHLLPLLVSDSNPCQQLIPPHPYWSRIYSWQGNQSMTQSGEVVKKRKYTKAINLRVLSWG